MMGGDRSYRNQERLEASVRSLTDRFGLDVLRHPSRLRNLLRDDYGDHDDRVDIDDFVTVLESNPLASLAEGESLSNVATHVARETQLDARRVSWTLSMLESLHPDSRVTTDRVGEHQTQIGTNDMTVVGEPAGPPPVSGTRGWIVALVFVALVGLAGTTIAWFVGQGRADDWEQRALAAERAVKAPDRSSGDVPVEELSDEPSDDSVTGDPTTDGATDDGTSDQAGSLQQQIDALSARNAELGVELASASQRIEEKDATISGLNNQLEPFESSDFAPPVGPLPGTGELVACDGFSDGCVETFYQNSFIVLEGEQRYFESREIAKVPITTADGLRWTGSADVIGAYGGHTCNGDPVKTVMTVDLLPARVEADPKAKSVHVVAYTVTFTLSSVGSACTAASSTYRGTYSY